MIDFTTICVDGYLEAGHFDQVGGRWFVRGRVRQSSIPKYEPGNMVSTDAIKKIFIQTDNGTFEVELL